MSLDVNFSEPDEFNCHELHTTISEVAKIKDLSNYHYHVDYICGKGENYIANIFRTILTDSEDNKTASVIVKTLINKDRMELYHELHEREVAVYKTILLKYVKFQQVLPFEQRILFPEHIYSVIENSKDVLVLEDMEEKGYLTDKTLPKYSLDYKQASDILKELAKFHSLSIIYEKHEPKTFVKLKKEFRDIIFCESFLNKTKLWNYFHDSFGTSLDLVENCEAKRKLVSVEGKLLELLRWYTKSVECGVLCHGDFWINNIMLKHEETNKGQACFIDFQTMRHSSPTTDIFHFLYLCTDSNFRNEYLTTLYKDYYDTLKCFLSLYDIDANLVYNKEQFEKDLEEYKPYGFLIAMLELKLVTLSVEENEFPDDEVDKISNFNSKDVGEYYKIMINDVVNESLENGVIDKLIEKINYL